GKQTSQAVGHIESAEVVAAEKSSNTAADKAGSWGPGNTTCLTLVGMKCSCISCRAPGMAARTPCPQTLVPPDPAATGCTHLGSCGPKGKSASNCSGTGSEPQLPGPFAPQAPTRRSESQ